MSCKIEGCWYDEKVYDEKVYDEKEGKCILHCDKIESTSFWKENENSNPIPSFWRVIRWLIAEKKEHSQGFQFENIIFPKFELHSEISNSQDGNKSILEEQFKIFINESEPESLNFDFKKYNISETIRFKNCHFIDSAKFEDYEFYNSLEFESCTFSKGFFSKKRFLKMLHFKDCDFGNNEIDFSNSIFKNKFELINCKNIKKIDFSASKFEDVVNLTENDFSEAIFKNTIFEKSVIFNHSRFNEDLNFEDTEFLGNLFCKDITLTKSLNLQTSAINENAYFLGIKFENESSSVSNRETARIIKHEFDKSNNIIEANKFYAIEMKEREKELTIKQPFEWLVFKVHGLSSNHTQDWLLSLLWIVIITLFYSISEVKEYPTIAIPILIAVSLILGRFSNFINKITLMIGICTVYTFSEVTLDIFAKNLNLFAKVKTNDMTFSLLIFKVIIAYLVYQFVMSIRQNTRRT